MVGKVTLAYRKGAEIREIRLNERHLYQKITDIYTTSVDYNKDAPTTREFFAKVQNKLHFAIHLPTEEQKAAWLAWGEMVEHQIANEPTNIISIKSIAIA